MKEFWRWLKAMGSAVGMSLAVWLLVGVIVLLAAPGAMAGQDDLEVTSGTATCEFRNINTALEVYRITATADAPGSVTLATQPIYGTIVGVVTNPADGDDAPSDNWDLAIYDEDGRDVLGGAGANRDTANTESFVPTLAGSVADTWAGVVVGGVLSLEAAHCGESNGFVVVIYVEK